MTPPSVVHARKKIRQPRPLASELNLRAADSPYLTAQEAAQYLRFASVGALYQAVANGGAGIPVCHRGRTLLFHREHLDRWLAGERRVTLLSEARAKVG